MDPVGATQKALKAGLGDFRAGRIRQAIERWESVFRSKERVNVATTLILCRFLGIAHECQGNSANAICWLSRACAIARAANRTTELVKCLGCLSESLRSLGDGGGSTACLAERADIISRTPALSSLLGSSHSRTGWNYVEMGLLAASTEGSMGSEKKSTSCLEISVSPWNRCSNHFRSDLQYSLAAQNSQGTALGYVNMGFILSLSGDESRSLEHFQMGADAATKATCVQSSVAIATSTGVAHWMAGLYSQAEHCFLEALGLVRNCGDIVTEVAILCNLVHCIAAQNQFIVASQVFYAKTLLISDKNIDASGYSHSNVVISEDLFHQVNNLALIHFVHQKKRLFCSGMADRRKPRSSISPSTDGRSTPQYDPSFPVENHHISKNEPLNERSDIIIHPFLDQRLSLKHIRLLRHRLDTALSLYFCNYNNININSSLLLDCCASQVLRLTSTICACLFAPELFPDVDGENLEVVSLENEALFERLALANLRSIRSRLSSDTCLLQVIQYRKWSFVSSPKAEDNDDRVAVIAIRGLGGVDQGVSDVMIIDAGPLMALSTLLETFLSFLSSGIGNSEVARSAAISIRRALLDPVSLLLSRCPSLIMCMGSCTALSSLPVIALPLDDSIPLFLSISHIQSPADLMGDVCVRENNDDSVGNPRLNLSVIATVESPSSEEQLAQVVRDLQIPSCYHDTKITANVDGSGLFSSCDRSLEHEMLSSLVSEHSIHLKSPFLVDASGIPLASRIVHISAPLFFTVSRKVVVGIWQGSSWCFTPMNDPSLIYSLNLDLEPVEIIVISSFPCGMKSHADYIDFLFHLQKVLGIATCGHGGAVIAPMWPISDIDSSTFLNIFYNTFLTLHKSPSETLAYSQQAYAGKGKGKGWSSFICIGDSPSRGRGVRGGKRRALMRSLELEEAATEAAEARRVRQQRGPILMDGADRQSNNVNISDKVVLDPPSNVPVLNRPSPLDSVLFQRFDSSTPHFGGIGAIAASAESNSIGNGLPITPQFVASPTDRLFVMQGIAMKREYATSPWKRRWFLLTKYKQLLYFKNQSDVLPVNVFLLENYDFSFIQSFPPCHCGCAIRMRKREASRTYHLVPSFKEVWMDVIKAALAAAPVMDVENRELCFVGKKQPGCGRAIWCPDVLCPNCSQCGKLFNSIFRLRHHCRECGQLFCGTCCGDYKALATGYGEAVRVCQPCWKTLGDIKDAKRHNPNSGFKKN